MLKQDFHLYEATLENKKIDELQSEGQSQETIVIENPDLEGDTAKTNPSNDTEELEQVSASHTEEELKIKDGGKIIQEEAKVIEETNDMRLLESAKESRFLKFSNCILVLSVFCFGPKTH